MAYQSKFLQVKESDVENFGNEYLQDEEKLEYVDEIKEYNVVVNSIITQNPNCTVCKASSSGD